MIDSHLAQDIAHSVTYVVYDRAIVESAVAEAKYS
jgi:hypothetical protein